MSFKASKWYGGRFITKAENKECFLISYLLCLDKIRLDMESGHTVQAYAAAFSVCKIRLLFCFSR